MNVCYYQTMNSIGTDLLLHHYLDWQKSEGQVKSLKKFASYCNINESYLNLVMNGKRPFTLKMALKLAELFHDPRFYDVVNLPRPDPYLQTLNRLWPSLKEEERKYLLDKAENYVEENEHPARLDPGMEKAP